MGHLSTLSDEAVRSRLAQSGELDVETAKHLIRCRPALLEDILTEGRLSALNLTIIRLMAENEANADD